MMRAPRHEESDSDTLSVCNITFFYFSVIHSSSFYLLIFLFSRYESSFIRLHACLKLSFILRLQEASAVAIFLLYALHNVPAEYPHRPPFQEADSHGYTVPAALPRSFLQSPDLPLPYSIQAGSLSFGVSARNSPVLSIKFIITFFDKSFNKDKGNSLKLR